MKEALRRGLRPEEAVHLGQMLGRAEAFQRQLQEQAERSNCPLVKKRVEVGDGWVKAVKWELFEPFIQKKEREFIEQEIGLKRVILATESLINFIRGDGLSINEAYERVISRPDSEQDIPAFARARDFLTEHATRFEIEI